MFFLFKLECLQEKWIPVFGLEARQYKDLESGFDSIKTVKALGVCAWALNSLLSRLQADIGQPNDTIVGR